MQQNEPERAPILNQEETSAPYFGETPLSMKCPFCLQFIRTEIVMKPQASSFLLGLLIYTIIPHHLTLAAALLIIHILATRKHECPLCAAQLGSDGTFMLCLKDDVFSFQFGTEGIIVSKKNLVTVVLFVLIFAVCSFRALTYNPSFDWLNESWDEFSMLCPQQKNDCLNLYAGKVVKNWEGYMMKLELLGMHSEGNAHSTSFAKKMMELNEHAVRLYLKMEPSTRPIDFPDLVLAISSFTANEFEPGLLEGLRHGDKVQFNGTLLGSRVEWGQGFRLVQGWNLKKTGHKDNVPVWQHSIVSPGKLRIHFKEGDEDP